MVPSLRTQCVVSAGSIASQGWTAAVRVQSSNSESRSSDLSFPPYSPGIAELWIHFRRTIPTTTASRELRRKSRIPESVVDDERTRAATARRWTLLEIFRTLPWWSPCFSWALLRGSFVLVASAKRLGGLFAFGDELNFADLKELSTLHTKSL